MSKHASPATTIWFPNQRVARTIIQVTASVILGLVAFVAALAVFAPQFVAALEPILPPTWYAWLTAAVLFIGTLAGVLAKIMAIPGVNDWLSRHSALGSAPRAEIPELEQRAYADADAKAQRELRPLD